MRRVNGHNETSGARPRRREGKKCPKQRLIKRSRPVRRTEITANNTAVTALLRCGLTDWIHNDFSIRFKDARLPRDRSRDFCCDKKRITDEIGRTHIANELLFIYSLKICGRHPFDTKHNTNIRKIIVPYITKITKRDKLGEKKKKIQ